jgi:CelD/BcsL family acetyltransferase involved in cellulose biosynthesis
MTTRIEWVEDLARFEALALPWDALAASQRTPLLLSHAWFSAWWRWFGEGRLQTCVLWQDERMTAAFPLALQGGELRPLASNHGDFLVPLAASPEDLDRLIEAVLAHRFAAFVYVGMPREHPVAAALARRGARHLRIERSVDPDSVIDLPASFAEYEKTLSHNARGQINKFRRRLAKDHALSVRAVEPPADLERELAAALAIEASGWKGEEGTAIASSAASEGFYRTVCAAFAKRGGLRLSFLEVDGRPVAFDLAVLDGSWLYSLKMSYTPEFEEYSPGILLRADVIRRCCELGLAANDLGGGGSGSRTKRRFRTRTLEATELRLFPRRPAGLARYLRQRARLDLQAWIAADPRRKRLNTRFWRWLRRRFAGLRRAGSEIAVARRGARDESESDGGA